MRRIACLIAAGLAVLVFATSAARAAVKTETVPYRVGDKEFTGYLAYDDAIAGKRPGVLVVHEWWGLNAYARKRAEMLAGLGYTAFALDMYGTGQVADHPESAKAFSQAVMSDLAEAAKRFDAAKAVLLQQPTVDGTKVAAIGYCMGGSIVLNMARSGADLSGVVSYHGGLAAKTPAEPGKVKANVLVFTGQADPMVPTEQVQASNSAFCHDSDRRSPANSAAGLIATFLSVLALVDVMRRITPSAVFKAAASTCSALILSACSAGA